MIMTKLRMDGRTDAQTDGCAENKIVFTIWSSHYFTFTWQSSEPNNKFLQYHINPCSIFLLWSRVALFFLLLRITLLSEWISWEVLRQFGMLVPPNLQIYSNLIFSPFIQEGQLEVEEKGGGKEDGIKHTTRGRGFSCGDKWSV